MNHLSNEQLQLFIENKNLANSNEIQDHIYNCQACKTNLNAYRKIYDVLSNEEIPELSDDFIRSTVGKLKSHNDQKWIALENITIAIMCVVSLGIGIYFLDYLNVLSLFKEIDFSLLSGFGKRLINIISPNIIYIIAALLITISIEIIDRFKIQKLYR